MDVNLTAQVLNGSLKLTGLISDSPWWTSILNPANWLPVLVVLIGAYATYFYANQLSDRKNQYDLKVKVYFELLEALYLIESLKKSYKADFKDHQTTSFNYPETLRSLDQIEAKLQVVGSRDVFEAYLDFHGSSPNSKLM